MLSGPTAFHTVLTTVKTACVTALQSTGNVPARVAIVPGAIAWDDCGECGLLALASARNFLSEQFPIEVVTSAMASGMPGALLCADMTVQVIRCAPQPQGNALSPATAALEASAQLVVTDAYTVLCATMDTLMEMVASNDIADFIVRQQMFVGPAGACVGSELTFAVGVIR